MAGSLEQGADYADAAADGHADPAAVAVGAGTREEGACDVADNVEGGDKALVAGGDAEVGRE